MGHKRRVVRQDVKRALNQWGDEAAEDVIMSLPRTEKAPRVRKPEEETHADPNTDRR